MPSSCSSQLLSRAEADPSFNATDIVVQRYRDSPKDDWDRLLECWGYQDCGDCHRSDGFCGWCPISSTCLPLPTDPFSRAIPLLAPIRYKSICALGSERFELRTAGLGCQVSTITVLTSIVTIFCTALCIALLYLLLKCAKWIGVGSRATIGGYMVYPSADDLLQGEIWVRKSESWGTWWRRVRGEQKEFEFEEIDDGTPKRGKAWWGVGESRKSGFRSAERRPLLEGDLGDDFRRLE